MRKSVILLTALVAAATCLTGCRTVQKAERKMGRGLANSTEIIRWGEMQRSIEQASLFEGANAGFTQGFVSGFNKTLARTGIGVYEMVTAPFPPYDPVNTHGYLSPGIAFPDSYKPGLRATQALSTDDRLYFSGGTILPWVPGNRFRIFDNN